MKISKTDALWVTFSVPELRLGQQDLTPFAGLVLFQSLFKQLRLCKRLSRCFQHGVVRLIYPHTRIILFLIVHMLLGFRHLRDSDYYHDDPMVLRMVGLQRLPSVSTISRKLASLDEKGVQKLETLRTDLVLELLAQLGSSRITLNFDGSVIGTKRREEGTAVGFNKSKKGQRAYYPLFCTVA